MVPSMMYQLLNHPEFSKVDLDNLESVSTGTSQLHNGLREKFESRANNSPFLTEGICTLHLEEPDLTDGLGYGLSESVCLGIRGECFISD